MPLCMLLVSALFLQDFTSTNSKSWEAMARPWMTEAELNLYESLSEREKTRFQGFFVARRLDNPNDWPATGLYLPSFFAPEPYGDVRDQIAHLLGHPVETEWQPQNPVLPRTWKFPQYSFSFLPAGNGKVRLATDSLQLWDSLKDGMILNRALRYDFRDNSFGRTRLPEDLEWTDTRLLYRWLEPNPSGGTLRLAVAVPESMKAYIRSGNHRPRQHLELLAFLKSDVDQPRESLPSSLVRHASAWSHLTDEDEIYFEIALPPGYFHAEFLIYNGFLEQGLRTETPVAIVPPGLPRIGEPVISHRWQPAGIQEVGAQQIDCGGDRYQPALKYDRTQPARVLVRVDGDERPQLFLQTAKDRPMGLQFLFTADGVAVFDLPAQKAPFRLIALGAETPDGQLALSVKGEDIDIAKPSQVPAFAQKSEDYVSVDKLNFGARGNLQLLFVNDQAFLASRTGLFKWPPLDWGREATLRYEFGDGEGWFATEYTTRRTPVFEQLRVKPKYLVAGTRVPDGTIEPVDFEIFVEGAKIPAAKKTPFTRIPKLWGIVVNDPLLKSPAWNNIRQALMAWLKKNTQPQDQIYVVQISHRPELLVAPTTRKVLIQACLDALEPSSPRANYFTVRYLVDALTHMKQHTTLPHQAILLTHQLTDEVSQMEDLLPLLRRTGLQIYNLEFPFEFNPDTEIPAKPDADDALANMAAQAKYEEKMLLGVRDNFQEKSVTQAGFKIPLSGRKKEKMAEQERIKEEAFRASFSTQLASMTAGLAHVTGAGETSQSLHRFLDQLTQWQRTLVHMELPLPYVDESMIRVQAKPGYSVAWTLVEWSP
ncbi:hypothetical protein SCOR_12820 [Sulfidibacter corallicola]|uniref:Uncharacterized protein n=1 Tax=Sulfidibacter corallicola TaxID=2818388 RepID=A0A8A4TCG2_SULCO|nr:hypothetical protein [Sulfidibacter corallicola]QTD47789.1 hypothetical protein J3U87_19550 [Sulfidibacter corallicola]